MAKGASSSQAGQAGRGAAAAPTSGPAAAAAAGIRRRSAAAAAAKPAASRPQGGSTAGTLKFYTDDAPGLKIGPNTVLVTSLVFIAFVVLLHVLGKLQK